MNIATIKQFDVSNGPGVRVSIFVSGCSLHCKGCHNQDAWDFNFGSPFTDELLENVLNTCDRTSISGISILGGEPLDPRNRDCVLHIIQEFRKKFGTQKTVWLWTGYTLEDLKKEKSSVVSSILKLVDTIVDGPFKEELRDVTLKFRGSTNQRILEKIPNENKVKVSTYN